MWRKSKDNSCIRNNKKLDQMRTKNLIEDTLESFKKIIRNDKRIMLVDFNVAK